MTRFLFETRIGYGLVLTLVSGLVGFLFYLWLGKFSGFYAFSGGMFAAINGLIRRRKQITDWV